MVTTIVSASAVASPITAARAAIVHIEVLERLGGASDASAESTPELDAYAALGVVVLGDLLRLRDPDGDEITIVARRARIRPASPQPPAMPLEHLPAEMVPILGKASGRGVLCYREITLGTGDAVLLTAVVESSGVVPTADGAGTRKAFVARDDLAAVVLEPVLASPDR